MEGNIGDESTPDEQQMEVLEDIWLKAGEIGKHPPRILIFNILQKACLKEQWAKFGRKFTNKVSLEIAVVFLHVITSSSFGSCNSIH